MSFWWKWTVRIWTAFWLAINQVNFFTGHEVMGAITLCFVAGCVFLSIADAFVVDRIKIKRAVYEVRYPGFNRSLEYMLEAHKRARMGRIRRWIHS
jgi:hypothetical protein